MSSPRERPDGGFEHRREDGSGWQEPAHLGEGPSERPPAGEPADPPRADAGSGGWEPPGWSLPPANRDEPAPPPSTGAGGDAFPAPGVPPVPGPSTGEAPRTEPVPPRRPGVVQQVFRYQGDAVGAQGWAVQQGWTVSDGAGPADGVLHELIATAPVRLTKDHRPAAVLRGRAGPLELVAFDVVYASGRYVVPEYAVTAAPVLTAVPGLRLSPARFWKHRTGGLVQVPSGDPEFDTRWVLLAAEDGPAVRHLVQDPTVRGLLLGSDDGDEFWSAAGHVAAVRPDGHRPELLEHHARLLTAVVGALAVTP